MKVLSVASELFPLIKTGGLADVAGALPLALAERGISVTSLVPGYPQVMKVLEPENPSKVAGFSNLLGEKADILSASHKGLDLLILDAPALFDRPGGPYVDTSGSDYADNWKRYAAFSKAAAEIALGRFAGYRADIVHAHDWQAAMTLAYLRYSGRAAPPGVMTIHNLAFQGRFPASIFASMELPASAYSLDGVEYYHGVGFLKAGLQAADAITTVSPAYAQEIRTPEFGMGLEGLLNARAADLHGIVNGIDTAYWNPASDIHLTSTYTPRMLQRRALNRQVVEERFALDQDASPLFCIISRLTWQKGMDVMSECIDSIVEKGARVAILGSGDKAIETTIHAAAKRHEGRAAVVTGYDEPLSHLLQGGSDAILIPSRFEPCGLTQLCGLRYGCIPVVARTGGLADTLIDANEAALMAGVATGIQFAPLTADALLHAVSRTIDIHRDKKAWATMQRNGMRADVSWSASATRYASLFQSLLSGSRH